MNTKELISGLDLLLKQLKLTKDEFTDTAKKDIRNIKKVLKSGGNVEDIQNVAMWNYSAYFFVDIPPKTSLKMLREQNNNNISMLLGVKSFNEIYGLFNK